MTPQQIRAKLDDLRGRVDVFCDQMKLLNLLRDEFRALGMLDMVGLMTACDQAFALTRADLLAECEVLLASSAEGFRRSTAYSVFEFTFDDPRFN